MSDRGTGRTTEQMKRCVQMASQGKSSYYASSSPQHDFRQFLDRFVYNQGHELFKVFPSALSVRWNDTGAFIEFIGMGSQLRGQRPRHIEVDHYLTEEPKFTMRPEYREFWDVLEYWESELKQT